MEWWSIKNRQYVTTQLKTSYELCQCTSNINVFLRTACRLSTHCLQTDWLYLIWTIWLHQIACILPGVFLVALRDLSTFVVLPNARVKTNECLVSKKVWRAREGREWSCSIFWTNGAFRDSGLKIFLSVASFTCSLWKISSIPLNSGCPSFKLIARYTFLVGNITLYFAFLNKT